MVDKTCYKWRQKSATFHLFYFFHTCLLQTLQTWLDRSIPQWISLSRKKRKSKFETEGNVLLAISRRLCFSLACFQDPCTHVFHDVQIATGKISTYFQINLPIGRNKPRIDFQIQLKISQTIHFIVSLLNWRQLWSCGRKKIFLYFQIIYSVIKHVSA